MDIETVRRISLARHLFELAASSLRSNNDLYLFTAANLLQDAVEAFLIAVADHVGAMIDQNTKFDKYFILINEKIVPKELPFRAKLLRLNRIRVDSKHYGIQPARDECDRLAVAAREFFDEVSASLLGVSFATVSAIDLLEEGEPKQMLLAAKAALEAGDHESCVINCRKALYLEIERSYDVAEYKEGKPKGLLAGLRTDAPFYARSKEYIDKNVHDPTDFIVRDHGKIEQQLLTQGVDTTAFWNVWRLTPEVYRTRPGQWIVKYEFDKLDRDLLGAKVEYVFPATVDILLAIHTTRKATRLLTSRQRYAELAQKNVPVYQKADKKSIVVGTIPPGVTRVHTSFRVLGLEGDGPYWCVMHVEKGLILFGYVHNDYVKDG